MPTQWYPTGVTDYKLVKLTNGQKIRFTDEFVAAGLEINDPCRFFSQIESALASYKAMCSIREESKPGQVRKNLGKSLDAALALNERLNQLDANSRLILSRISGGDISRLNGHLNQIVSALSQASHAADKFPQGRLTDYARLELARGVIKALNSEGVEPTTTKEGLFNNLLIISLEVATGKSVSAVHVLAAEAIRTYQSENN